LLWMYLTFPVPIYGTLWILFLAYIAKFLPVGVRATSTSMLQISSELEEASYASGASWGRTFYKILLPLLVPGFVAGWIFVSVVALREFGTSILLYAERSIVLSVLVFLYWGDGRYAAAGALGVA